MNIDLDALERAADDTDYTELATLVKIARAARVWTRARNLQTGTPLERSMLADALAIAVEQAGLA